MAKELSTRQEPRLPRVDSIESFDRELSQIAKEINGSTPTGQRMPHEQHQFVALQKQAIEAMITTHQSAVTEVTNLLEEAKAAGDKMMAEMEERSTRLAELLERSKEFGSKTLELCKKFVDPAG